MRGEHLYKVDESGFPTSYVIAYFDEEGNLITEVDEDIIKEVIAQGIYKPRWNGQEWVESLTQEEIEELNKQPEKEPNQIEILQEQVLQLQEYIINKEKESLLMKGGIIDVI